MTPFGEKLRSLRARKGVSQKDLAKAFGVSAAYLSALEHGRRGAPSFLLVQQVIEYFGLIWDEAEDVMAAARLSKPKLVIDTSGLDPRATIFAHLVVDKIRHLSPERLEALIKLVQESNND